jgi:hypothetical protein
MVIGFQEGGSSDQPHIERASLRLRDAGVAVHAAPALD